MLRILFCVLFVWGCNENEFSTSGDKGKPRTATNTNNFQPTTQGGGGSFPPGGQTGLPPGSGPNGGLTIEDGFIQTKVISFVFEDSMLASAHVMRDISLCLHGNFQFNETTRAVKIEPGSPVKADIRLAGACTHQFWMEVFDESGSTVVQSQNFASGGSIERTEQTNITVDKPSLLKVSWQHLSGAQCAYPGGRDYHDRTTVTQGSGGSWPVPKLYNGSCGDLSP